MFKSKYAAVHLVCANVVHGPQGKMTKSAYRRENLPTRHKRQGKELQELSRQRAEKPSMLFRVLADAHCRRKMKQVGTVKLVWLKVQALMHTQSSQTHQQ